MSTPAAPAKLGAKARRLWRETVDQFELREDELRVLEDACREVDLIERLDRELSQSDLIVTGSQGQPVTNPLVSEIRQHRATAQRLLASLKLADEVTAEQRSAQMRDLVNKRWHGRRSGAA